MDGILILAKPVGPTSHDLVALVRRLSGTKRVGHGGTLDPFASGVLPIFLGRATRMLEYHLADGKAYRATVCLGATSTTDDLEGELTTVGTAPDRAALETALDAFRGPIVQVPPAYSAVKVAGRRAYAMARAGETPTLEPRPVRIDRLELLEWDASDPTRPIAVIDVECSAGTYVRALARDLGAALGTGAYLGALVRTASGPFRLESARQVETVRAAAAEGRLEGLLLPADTGLEMLPTVRVGPDEIGEIARGRAIPFTERPTPVTDTRFRLLDSDGRLVAMGVVHGDRLAPEKVFVDPAGRPLEQADASRGASAGRADGSPAVVHAAAEGAPDLPGSLPAVDPHPVDPEILAERDPAQSIDPDPASPDVP